MLISLTHEKADAGFFFNHEMRYTFVKMPRRGAKMRLVYMGGTTIVNRGYQMHLTFPDLMSSHYKTVLLDDTDSYEIGEIAMGNSGGLNAISTAENRGAVFSQVMDIDLGLMNPDINYFRVLVGGRKNTSNSSASYLSTASVIVEIDDGDLD